MTSRKSMPPIKKKTPAQLDREINEVLSGTGTFGSGPGSGTHAASHSSDAPSIPSSSSSTLDGDEPCASRRNDDARLVRERRTADERDQGVYRSKDAPGTREAAARGRLETIPAKLVSRHFAKSGAMTVTDHSKGALGTHPDEIRNAGSAISEAQPWKARRR